ncbi:hypothetical protein CC86DRAFT_472659 [Ophiobolus disseminans]|uniref:GST N-terminal domain-containing protein n=1 Tax=Ophiobolus disseminans TaxID=1469910 RepID=A0A6A6ZDN9_9PLEO|nr:hypothetical protein CC86DRAFT_472659 [Ophiobolus disseminans]
MSSILTNTKTTIWIWPSGLFPRRVLYYFLAKGINVSTLKSHNIILIPIDLIISPLSLQSKTGHEPRPADTSLPVLRIEHSDGRITWIRESLAILHYLEELFPPSAGYPDLQGSSAEQRAQMRDMLSVLGEAMHWSLVSLIHSNTSTTNWSGLDEEQMSAVTAAHADQKHIVLLLRLEKWVEERVSHGIMDYVTFAGLGLLAQVEYAEMMFGTDWVADHVVLRTWVEELKGEPWYVSNERLKDVERSGDWSTLMGN